jgi:hypothetical protein
MVVKSIPDNVAVSNCIVSIVISKSYEKLSFALLDDMK